MTHRTLGLSTQTPLRRIQVDLRPEIPQPIIAYERENLDEDELLERALGVQEAEGNAAAGTRQFHDTLGLHAWPSGFVAAKCILDMLPNERDQYKVLELGCGTGIPSLAAYNAGVNVVIATDLDVDLISRSFEEQSQTCGNAFRCMELDLLNKLACENLIKDTRPNLIIAADCFYDAALAKSVGQIMGIAVQNYGCNILVADPGRLDGRGRDLFLDGFKSELSSLTADTRRQMNLFEDVDMPQSLLKECGASLSWCGVLETKVGVFRWINADN